LTIEIFRATATLVRERGAVTLQIRPEAHRPPSLYVITHSATAEKKKQLDRISEELGMGWKVEIIK